MSEDDIGDRHGRRALLVAKAVGRHDQSPRLSARLGAPRRRDHGGDQPIELGHRRVGLGREEAGDGRRPGVGEHVEVGGDVVGRPDRPEMRPPVVGEVVDGVDAAPTDEVGEVVVERVGAQSRRRGARRARRSTRPPLAAPRVDRHRWTSPSTRRPRTGAGPPPRRWPRGRRSGRSSRRARARRRSGRPSPATRVRERRPARTVAGWGGRSSVTSSRMTKRPRSSPSRRRAAGGRRSAPPRGR